MMNKVHVNIYVKSIHSDSIFETSGSPNLSFTGVVMIFTGNGTWDSVMRSEVSISEGESVSFVFKKNNNNGQTNAFIDTGT
ncbi:MAG: hypothetical protein BGO33_09100 [Bacteroidia bacterium 43-41]|nr:MAG: hypothetical protein BGO33_09100 [Bacteroidia bacterium 43-41]